MPKNYKLPADFTLSGREFHRVDPATEKDLDQIFVLTLGVKRRLELDDGHPILIFVLFDGLVLPVILPRSRFGR